MTKKRRRFDPAKDALFTETHVCESCRHLIHEPEYIDVDPRKSHAADSYCNAPYGEVESVTLEIEHEVCTYYFCSERTER